MPINLETQFWQLVESAIELDTEARRMLLSDRDEPIDSNRMVEPVYVAICELVTNHPTDRDLFVRCFIELALLQRKSPWMLVPFCMRYLRLPEVKVALSQEMKRLGPGTAAYARMMNYCSSVMHAYHDEVWQDAISFDTFQHELPGHRNADESL